MNITEDTFEQLKYYTNELFNLVKDKKIEELSLDNKFHMNTLVDYINKYNERLYELFELNDHLVKIGNAEKVNKIN